MFRATLFLFCICFSISVHAQKVVHVFVALCDNENQGIVPVPQKLGNGLDPHNNLYWGAMYGVKSYFSRSSDWRLVKTEQNPAANVLERCIFYHAQTQTWMIADAYKGVEIKAAIEDFFAAAAGKLAATTEAEGKTLHGGGKANLVAFVGHDGLMDFSLSQYPQGQKDGSRKAVVLACYSKRFFSSGLSASGIEPLVWTTGLMAPEAYTLKSILDGWMAGETGEQVRERAAAAYHQYQKCGMRAARNLLVTGW